jgi:hypothetical protein
METDAEYYRHYRIKREELDPTRYNLFRWMDRVSEEVARVDEYLPGYEDRFNKDPDISRKLTIRSIFLGIYSTLTLPISIPALMYRAIKN